MPICDVEGSNSDNDGSSKSSGGVDCAGWNEITTYGQKIGCASKHKFSGATSGVLMRGLHNEICCSGSCVDSRFSIETSLRGVTFRKDGFPP